MVVGNCIYLDETREYNFDLVLDSCGYNLCPESNNLFCTPVYVMDEESVRLYKTYKYFYIKAGEFLSADYQKRVEKYKNKLSLYLKECFKGENYYYFCEGWLIQVIPKTTTITGPFVEEGCVSRLVMAY